MNSKHLQNIQELEAKCGFYRFRELIYRIARGDNFHKLAKEFGVTLFQVRYLSIVQNETTVYCYERSMPVTLIYSKTG